MLRRFSFAFALLLGGVSVCAQENAPDNSAPPPPPIRRGGAPPCWQIAGVARGVVDQLRSIAQDARSQVQNACSNTLLTPQQKRQQIEDIHQQSHAKMEDLINSGAAPDFHRVPRSPGRARSTQMV